MDQDAFRALLNTSSQRSTQHSRPNAKPLALGGGSTNKSANKSHVSGSAYKPSSSSSSSLKPRKFVSKDSAGTSKDGQPTTQAGYRDRASERRQGLDGDFAEAEHLLKNFQARVTAAGDQIDKDALERQTKYLGGDERHTILVKGLDHALLERRKAELAQGGKLGQVTDEDLESAYELNAQQSSSTHPPRSITPSLEKPSNKKNRDELLEQLKTSRNQQPPDLVVVEKLKAAGKFKPIGSTSIDQKPQDSERKEQKRRKTEKKKKKKAKVEHPVTSSTATTDPFPQKTETSAGSKIIEKSTGEDLRIEKSELTQAEIEASSKKQSKEIDLVASVPTLENTRPEQSPQRGESIKDEDFDIFWDAGEYKGLDEESSDEEDRKQKVQRSGSLTEAQSNQLHSQGTKKRKTYFEDDQVESDSNSEKSTNRQSVQESSSKLPESSLQKRMTVEQPDQEPIDESMGDDNDQDPSAISRLTRLESLSGSTDIKSILAADAFKEKEEKRKAKKQKNKSEKILTDKDRLNRDFLEMEKFLKHKKNPGPIDSLASTSTKP